MTKLKLGINKINNEEYHGDKNYLSSSSLKLLLKDLPKFHKEHILKVKGEREIRSAFDEGSYTHALILEPHMIEHEFAIFPGFTKRGKEWEAFKESEEVKGKTILSESQKFRCEDYHYAYKNNKTAIELISNGLSEHTICDEYRGVNLKSRCDFINIEEGYIVDVKTTSFPSDIDSFRQTIKMYEYDLSAYLYAFIAERYYKKHFDFYFVVIDKKNLVCDIYRASEDMMNRGKVKVEKSLDIYKNCLETGIWKPEILKAKRLTKNTGYEIMDI